MFRMRSRVSARLSHISCTSTRTASAPCTSGPRAPPPRSKALARTLAPASRGLGAAFRAPPPPPPGALAAKAELFEGTDYVPSSSSTASPRSRLGRAAYGVVSTPARPDGAAPLVSASPSDGCGLGLALTACAADAGGGVGQVPASGFAGGFGGYRRQIGGSAGLGAVPRADPDEVRQAVHGAMTKAVSDALDPLMRLETEWTLPDAVKRIVKYFYKACTFELVGMQWSKAVELFVENAVSNYSSACCDKPWFFDLDLRSAITDGCWEIVRRGSCVPRPTFQTMEKVVDARYDELMDDILLDKALWDVTAATFGGEGNSKIYKAIKVGHGASFNEAKTDSRPMTDAERVELFTRLWVDDSMGRAWQSVDYVERILTFDTVVKLFQNLIAPFGEDHPFSCVPTALTKGIGRPPASWDFLEQCVAQFFKVWGRPGLGKRGSAGGDDGLQLTSAAEAADVTKTSSIFGAGLEAPEVKRRRATYGIASAAQRAAAAVAGSSVGSGGSAAPPAAAAGGGVGSFGGGSAAGAPAGDDEDDDGVLPGLAAARVAAAAVQADEAARATAMAAVPKSAGPRRLVPPPPPPPSSGLPGLLRPKDEADA
mmetsp:Transcript_111919/g.361456  ORF Transcript_111919/g.361456 Transcript_111919/m.361456 type:complete len:598 (-) Transcript_111919:126-1919(-)